MVGLTDKANALPDSLFGGQAQRVAIARALAMEQGVIVEEGKPHQIFEAPTQERTKSFLSKVL